MLSMMETMFGLCLLVGAAVQFCGAYEYDPNYMTPPKCKPCDAKSCPELTFCAGRKVKDHCGCCHRCSSDLFQPHVPRPAQRPLVPVPEPETTPSQEAACKERKCGKFKICVFNSQKLPICTCPSEKLCRSRRGKRAKFSKDLKVCGTDGKTYESRCHMRIANCNSGKRIRRKHVGKCITAQTASPPIVLKPVTESNNQLNSPNPTISPEDIKKLKRAERRRIRKLNRRLERKRKKELKRKMRKENKRKARREMERRERKKIQRRKKRMNNSYSVYSRDYGYLLGKHTTWGRSQVRKSRI